MSALGMTLMISSPFLAGGLVWLALKWIERHNARRYQRVIDKRNAQQELYGLKPFRGTKGWMR